MDFAEPKLVTLAAVLTPLTGLFLWWAWRRKLAALSLFVRARLLSDLTVGLSKRRQIGKRWLLLAGVGCILLALARPRLGIGDEVAQASGRDIIVCVDVSRSMMATDVAPSRLARTKLACYDLLAAAKTDRIGLIAFAGSAFLQCPLALDSEAFRQNVAALDTDAIPDQGTALGDALDEALESFNADSGTSKAVILITDGEDHEDQALSAARRLARENIRLFTVGVGTPNGELLKSSDPYGNSVFFKDEDGNPVKSKLNEDLLKQISEAARGFYLPLQTSRTMATLYERGIAPLETTKFSATTVRSRIERFQWPLGLGILLLLMEMLIPEASKETRRAQAPAAVPAGAVVAMLLSCLSILPLRASPEDALEKYKRGEFEKAREEYEKLAKEKPEDFRLRFNAGAAAYKQGDYKGAAGLFEQVLRSPDLSLQQQGWYNLGNSRFQTGEAEQDPSKKREQWEQALASYNAALKLNPSDPDARGNYEHVRRAIEMIPPPPEDQQQQEGDDKNDKNQQPKDSKNQQQKKQSKNDRQQQEKNQQQQQEQKNQQAKQDGQTNSPPSKDGQKQEQANDPQNQKQQGQGQGEQANSDEKGDKQDGKDGKKNASGERVEVGQDGNDRRGDAGQEGEEGKDERKGTLMTIREAEKVLDAQKNSEKALIFRNREGGENGTGVPQGKRRKQW